MFFRDRSVAIGGLLPQSSAKHTLTWRALDRARNLAEVLEARLGTAFHKANRADQLFDVLDLDTELESSQWSQEVKRVARCFGFDESTRSESCALSAPCFKA